MLKQARLSGTVPLMGENKGLTRRQTDRLDGYISCKYLGARWDGFKRLSVWCTPLIEISVIYESTLYFQCDPQRSISNSHVNVNSLLQNEVSNPVCHSCDRKIHFDLPHYI